MSTKRSYLIIISLLTIMALSGALLSSTVFADSNIAQDNVAVSVPVSCTMNGTGMTSHTANIPNGTYESEIGTTTLKSFCNDSQGFAIYAIGYTNEEYGNTNLIGASGGQTIVTGTATTTGNPDVSNWAVKLETSSGATYPLTLDNGFGSYSSVPSSYTKVAHRDSGTDLGSSATGASLTTTYAAYISKTQQADTYNGKVKYTLVHPSSAPAPGPKSLDTATTLQDVEYCSNELTVGQVYTLMDSRDGQSYKVARLADDNCWMLENLRLDLTDSTTQSNLTSATTNATDASLSYIISGSGVTYRDATSDPNGNRPTAGLNSTAWTSNSQDFYSVPMIMSSGTCYNNVYCVDSPSSGQWNSGAITPATINGITSIAQGKVGIYYNYCAASAGSYCYGNGTASTGSPSTDPNPNSFRDVTEDLCPIGWHMPTGAGGEYWALYIAYNSNVIDFQTALNTPLSGLFKSGKARSQGSGGYFWSSTWSSSGNMKRLEVNSNEVNSGNGNYSHYGFSLRCSLGS